LSIAIDFEGLTSSPVFGFFTSLHWGYFSAQLMGKGQSGKSGGGNTLSVQQKGRFPPITRGGLPDLQRLDMDC